MNKCRTSTYCMLATGLPFFLATALAVAGDTDPSKEAEALFERGRVLLDEGKYEAACKAFDESMRLEPGGGTLLNLALCHEFEGMFATAIREYREALDRAIADGRQDRIGLARERLEVISTRVAHYAVEMDDGAAATVTMDGKLVPSSAWETITLDPGQHVLVVLKAGAPRFEHRFSVPKGGGWRGRVQVPEAVVSHAAVLDEPPGPTPLQPPRGPVEQPLTERTTWHWVGLGVGVLGLATSAATGVVALEANSEADDRCIPGRSYCPEDGKAAADRANDFAFASTVSLGVGLTGLAVWMWLPRERAESGVELSTTPGGMLVTTRGRF